MPHRLLVLSPYPSAGGGPPPAPGWIAADASITWLPVPVLMSPQRGHADAVLEDLAVMSAGQEAASAGFDAVVVDSLGDGGAAALRSVLDLLVMGSGKTAALHALTLGTRFSFLVHSQAAAMRLRSELRQWTIESQCASVRVVAPDAAAGRETGQRCVREDAAEVICLGGGDAASVADDLAATLSVPCIDALRLTCELTAALLDAGLSHSRAAAPPPRVPKLAVVKAMAAAVTGEGSAPLSKQASGEASWNSN